MLTRRILVLASLAFIFTCQGVSASPGDSWTIPVDGWYRAVWAETCVAPVNGECVAEATHADSTILRARIAVETGDHGRLPGFGGASAWPVFLQRVSLPIGSRRSTVTMRVEANVLSVRHGARLGLTEEFAEFEFSGYLEGQGASGFQVLPLVPSGAGSGFHTLAFELDPCGGPVDGPVDLLLRAPLDTYVDVGEFPLPDWGRLGLDVDVRLIDVVVTAGEPC